MLKITIRNMPTIEELEKALPAFGLVNEHNSKPIKMTFPSGLSIVIEDVPEGEADEQD